MIALAACKCRSCRARAAREFVAILARSYTRAELDKMRAYARQTEGSDDGA